MVTTTASERRMSSALQLLELHMAARSLLCAGSYIRAWYLARCGHESSLRMHLWYQASSLLHQVVRCTGLRVQHEVRQRERDMTLIFNERMSHGWHTSHGKQRSSTNTQGYNDNKNPTILHINTSTTIRVICTVPSASLCAAISMRVCCTLERACVANSWRQGACKPLPLPLGPTHAPSAARGICSTHGLLGAASSSLLHTWLCCTPSALAL
jgi:hypothetical protein